MPSGLITNMVGASAPLDIGITVKKFRNKVLVKNKVTDNHL